MKIYNHPLAPNPRRLRIFVAEKGLTIPYETVEILTGQNRAPEFLAKNPAGGVPVLELDDGSYLAESVAICRYLEGLHPDPNLMGRDNREQAYIEQWNRRMELNLFGPVTRAFQHTNPLFAARLKQFPDYGAMQVASAETQLEWLDKQLEDKEFIAGPRYTIADITALVAIDLGAQGAGLQSDPALKNVSRWHRAVSARPSAKA
ncbi:MAG: glutathione S-transferase family protein [Candidatus Binataceae bacterium]